MIGTPRVAVSFLRREEAPPRRPEPTRDVERRQPRSVPLVHVYMTPHYEQTRRVQAAVGQQVVQDRRGRSDLIPAEPFYIRLRIGEPAPGREVIAGTGPRFTIVGSR